MTKGNLFKPTKAVSLTMAKPEKSRKQIEREKLIAELDRIEARGKFYPLDEVIAECRARDSSR
jgi:hypothetical protein